MNTKIQKEMIHTRSQDDLDERTVNQAPDEVTLFGLRFNRVTREQALTLVIDEAVKRKRTFVVTPNVNMLTLLPFHSELTALFNQASILIVDGWPIVWASRWLGTNELPERVAGSDLFPLICEQASKLGLSMALMGGAEGVGAEAALRLTARYPGLNIVGVFSPPMEAEFSMHSTAEMVSFCNACKPDILLLGMGIPKQEKWISANIDKLDIGVALCFGGVIDFAAGKIKRSPRWVVNLGLEWLWRLFMSPRQYWRRTLLRFPLFFPMFAKALISSRFGRSA